MKTIITSLLLLVTGCSGVTYLGQVGDTKFYSVHNSKLDGPNFNALVSQTCCGVKVENTFGGPGFFTSVSPAIVSAAGDVGASATYGATLRPNNETNSSTASGTATGGKAIAKGQATVKQNADNTTTNNTNHVNSDNTTNTTEQTVNIH